MNLVIEVKSGTVQGVFSNHPDDIAVVVVDCDYDQPIAYPESPAPLDNLSTASAMALRELAEVELREKEIIVPSQRHLFYGTQNHPPCKKCGTSYSLDTKDALCQESWPDGYLPNSRIPRFTNGNLRHMERLNNEYKARRRQEKEAAS